MLAIRKASVRIKFQPFSSVTAFRGWYAKSETSSSSYTYKYNTGFNELPPPPHISDRSISTVKKFYSQNYSFVGKHSFFSKAGTKNSGEEDDDFKDCYGKHDASGDHVVEGKNENDGELNPEFEYEDEGNEFELSDIEEEATENDLAMSQLRKRRMYGKAFQLSKLVSGERYYACCVDWVAKEWGLQKAENYIEKKIPESFRRELVYEALLDNCVFMNNTTKAEQVFNKIKNQKLPLTTSACNQMLVLYKRTDRSKMDDVLLLMEKENIKPSLSTYRLLIDVKVQSGDLVGMEKIVEDMKGEEWFEPDLSFQAALARNYGKLGMIEKAKSVLKEMEGDNLNVKRRVCSYLFPIYALLGSPDDFKRVWEVCETNTRLHECLSAIHAFGKLKKVEEAEAVFDYFSKKRKKLWAKQYTAMLQVYTFNKMFSEGRNLVKRMNESGCEIGPESLDDLVKFYIEANEIEEACLYLNMGSPRIKGNPLFTTYLMVLDEYGKRGDVDNAEMIFKRMSKEGYVLSRRLYNSLLQAYINAKIPAYGLRKRLEDDGIIPTKFMEARLALIDSF